MYSRQQPSFQQASTQCSRPSTSGYGHAPTHNPPAALAPPPAPAPSALTSHDFTNWHRIGRGGFGKVYRATPLHPHFPTTPVAIKVVDKRQLKTLAAEQRLAQEVSIHESMDHAHIARIYESFEDDRFVYLVMEYCENGDLWQYLRKRLGGVAEGLAALGEGEARLVMRQVCEATAYIHRRGALHRDLKLANILLASNMHVRVCDFGLATRTSQRQQQQQQRGRHRGEEMTLCGTPSYISPEVLARLPYGSESDVWALGCLLVTLLTGAQPFGAVGRGDQITEDVVARQVRLPRTLSREARHLVFELLRVDPRERLRSEDILGHEFFAGGKPEVPLQRLEDNAGRDRILPHADNALNAAALVGERILPQRHASGAGRRPEAPALEPALAPAPALLRAADYLSNFSTARLPAPLKRTFKNGTLHLRRDHLLVLDLPSSPQLLALSSVHQRIYEFTRPNNPQTLHPSLARTTYPWQMDLLPAEVAKAVRVACRCVETLRGQQKRLGISTPQGKAWLYEDGPEGVFRLLFFNGVKVEITRTSKTPTAGERGSWAMVEIPCSEEGLPNEIQKCALGRADFDKRDNPETKVPGKLRGIIGHAMEALRRAVRFDLVLRGFEENMMAGREGEPEHEGEILYPVEVDWDQQDASEPFVPLGLRPRSSISRGLPQRSSQPQSQPQQPQQPQHQPQHQQQRGQRPISVGHPGGSTTLGSTFPPRRPNLGPITKLVEEFNHPPAPPSLLLQPSIINGSGTARNTSVTAAQLSKNNNDAEMGHLLAERTFRDACFLPDIGWCMAAQGGASGNGTGIGIGTGIGANGADDYLLTMLFCDGSRLLINVREQVASYEDEQTQYHGLPLSHSIPLKVKDRLRHLPDFLSLMGMH